MCRTFRRVDSIGLDNDVGDTLSDVTYHRRVVAVRALR